MKSTIFVLAIAVAAFIIGCDASTPTGSLAEATSTVISIAKSHPGSNQIPLSGLLRDVTYPGSPLTNLAISGYVEYTMIRVRGSLFDLQLTTNARMHDINFDEDGFSVQSTENHQVNVSEEGALLLTTSHVVEGSRFVLYLQFQITQGSIEVADQWLDCPICQ
jgi:hypothetical protein